MIVKTNTTECGSMIKEFQLLQAKLRLEIIPCKNLDKRKLNKVS